MFAVWIMLVEGEGKTCYFNCTSGTCTVMNTAIWDQVIVGMNDGEIRWKLDQLTVEVEDWGFLDYTQENLIVHKNLANIMLKIRGEIHMVTFIDMVVNGGKAVSWE